jgi:hypothetical protein
MSMPANVTSRRQTTGAASRLAPARPTSGREGAQGCPEQLARCEPRLAGRGQVAKLAARACLLVALGACRSFDTTDLLRHSAGTPESRGGDPTAPLAPTPTGAGLADPGLADAGSAGGLEAPDTAVGRQLEWFIDVVNQRAGVVGEVELRERFSERFLRAKSDVPALFAWLGTEQSPIGIAAFRGGASETQLQIVIQARTLQFEIGLRLDPATGAIDLLREWPVIDLDSGRPRTWEDVGSSLAGLASRATYLVASVDEGRCEPLHGLATDERLAIITSARLYVLAELARQIAGGTLSWSDTIAVREDLKSAPRSGLSGLPAGTLVPVLDVATKMIAISDYSAGDHLMDRLGRERVEAGLSASGHGAPELNTPFLMARELFLFKGNLSDEDVAAYLASDLPGKRAFLENLSAMPAPGAQPITPEWVDEIEWFASANELCDLMLLLDSSADQPGLAPIREVLSIDPGMPIDMQAFPYVAYHGGTEAGVRQMSWLARSAGGSRYFVTIGLHDRQVETDVVPYLKAGLGIFDLLASEERAQ